MLSEIDIRQGIDANYEMILEFQKYALEENDVEQKLKKISMTGLLYSVLTTGMYSSEVLEKEIANISELIAFDSYNIPHNNRVLHVMTKCSDYGGHAVLAQNWIKWDEEHVSSVVFTCMNKDEIPSAMKNVINTSGGEAISLEGEDIEKAKKLLEISKEYEFVFLHMHMYDIVPVLAYSHKNYKTPVIFCNHADFRFSLGFTVADMIVNITQYDVEKNIKYRGISEKRNKYITTPDAGNIGNVEKTKSVRAKFGIPAKCDYILSMGADYKYTTVLEWDFAAFVRTILNRIPEARFYIIGADNNIEKWKKLHEDTNGRASALGILSKEDVMALMSEARLYISSFPMLASGAMLARKCNIPNITLLTIGRAKEAYGNNSADSISELIEKSVDAWNGNGRKYIGDDSCIDLSKHSWKLRYKQMLSEIEGRHRTYYPMEAKRIVGKQEIINFEMMQNDAIGWINDFARQHKINYEVLRKFSQLDNKYKTKLNSARLTEWVSNEALCQQKNRERLIKWIRIKNANYSIAQYFIDKGIMRVSIYGMGDIGHLLWDELEKDGICVNCGIDLKAAIVKNDKRVVEPCKYYDVDEIIINTTVFSNKDISSFLQTEIKKERVISLDDILNDITRKLEE